MRRFRLGLERVHGWLGYCGTRLMAIVRVMRVAVQIAGGCGAWRVGAGQTAPQLQRDIFIDRARMRLLLLHAQLRQQVENDAGLHF